MKFKNLILSVSLSFASVLWADYYSFTTYRFPNSASVNATTTTGEFTLDEAQMRSLEYIAPVVNLSNYTVTFSSTKYYGTVSNITTGVNYPGASNPYKPQVTSFFQRFISWCQLHNISISNSEYWPVVVSSGSAYFQSFQPYVFQKEIYQKLSATQLLELDLIGYRLQSIQTDVSALIPSLESHAANVSNLAQIVSSATGVSTNLQYDIYNELYDINYALNSGSGLNGIYTKLELLDPTTASSYLLGQAFASVYGMESYPEQALVSSGLASNLQDAQNKLADPDWCHKNLVPAIQSQKRKNAYIQQFKQDGLTPPPGKTWDQLSENELETIANYSYNTPVSSNATLKAHALDYLKHIQDSNDSIDSSLNDLRQHIQGGPLEVNVMNWPDDLFNLGGISNIFADLSADFQNALTNFNPHYTWEDALFFNRSQYSWRGLNTLDFDPRQDPNRSAIGVSTFNFTPTGNYFQDVPNFLALQSRISVDIANMIATVTAYSQTNLADRASTADLEQQYQEEFLQQSAEALNEFEQSQSYSNLFARNARFIDTSSVFSTPSGFTQIFSGDHSIPSHVNLQLPSWHFGQDDQSTPDTGSTITIDTAQYATFFQNCRYVFLFLYWGMTVMIMIWLFRLFTRFISWIPLSLTGGGSHDTVSI